MATQDRQDNEICNTVLWYGVDSQITDSLAEIFIITGNKKIRSYVELQISEKVNV